MSFFGDLWGGIVHNFENIGIGFSFGASGGMIGAGFQGQNGFDYMWYYGGMAAGTAVGMFGGTTEEGMAVRGTTAAYEMIPKSRSLVAMEKEWPKNDGALGDWWRQTLPEGHIIDRYSTNESRLLNGKYASPSGTAIESRSLPQGLGDPQVYGRYVVNKSFEIEASVVAPAFGKSGGGLQYRLLEQNGIKPSMADYISNGHLREL